MNEYQVIAVRINNAERAFIDAVVEQFGKTEDEAAIILDVFKKQKAVKIDPVMGQFRLSNGAFWEAYVMDNALEMARS